MDTIGIDRKKRRRRRRIVVGVFAVLGLVTTLLLYNAGRTMWKYYKAYKLVTPTPTRTPRATLSPTPTAIPTLVPTPRATLTQVPSCSWAAAYVADVSIPDGTELSAGEEFTKTWLIQNQGTCNWREGEVELVLVNDGGIGAPGTVPIPATAFGREVEVSVPMRAPEAVGEYFSAWSACRGTSCFGIVTVVITVSK